jgi:hypothetical protein
MKSNTFRNMTLCSRVKVHKCFVWACLSYTSCWLLAWLPSWRGRLYVPPKHRWTSTILRGVKSQKLSCRDSRRSQTRWKEQILINVGRGSNNVVSTWNIMLCTVICWKSPDVSEEHACIFRVEEQGKRETSRACSLLYAGYLLGLLVNPEDRGHMFIRNIGLVSTAYTKLYPSRYNSQFSRS